MPLATKDDKLIVKDGKLCTSCCGDPPSGPGAWCEAPYEQIDMICAYTKEEAEAEAARLEANSTVWCGIESTGSKEAIQDGNSCSGEDKTGLPLCPDYQTAGCTGTNPGQNDPVYGDECDCGPGWWLEVWDLVPDAGWTCTEYQSEPVPPPSPFGHWHPGQTCENAGDCPEFPPPPPPVPGICLYREDGLGTCWGYYTDGNDLPTGVFPTEEAAQAYIDAGGCPDPDPSAPACAACICYPYEYEEGAWGIFQECVVYTEEYDEFDNETGNYICEKTIYLSNCTEEACQSQAESNPISGIEWRNDKPADKCKIVNSEEECTESTGTFCPDVTECPDNPSAGCPDPNRSNPLP